MKIRKAESGTLSAWQKNGLRYGLPLLGIVLLAGWLLRQPTEQAQLAGPAPAETAQPETPGNAAPAPVVEQPASTPTAAPESTPPVEATGRIRLAIAPWGEVYVDGKMAGVTPPLNELQLPPGKHRIEIRNADFAPHRRNIDLAADANLRIKHKFE